MPDVDLEIINVVGVISYRQELDLAALAETFESREEVSRVSYEPEMHHWVQAYFEPDDTYVAFYRSGRCSIIGVNSLEQFDDVVGRVNSVMRDLLGFEYTPEVEVSNIVVTTSINLDAQLEVLAMEFGFEHVEYEPEQFPALIYRDPESNAVISLFSSGKLHCTGLSDLELISERVEAFVEVVSSVK